MVMWRPDDANRDLAWWLILRATGGRRLADDWCADLAEVLARRPSTDVLVDEEQVVAWLHAEPAPEDLPPAVVRAA